MLKTAFVPIHMKVEQSWRPILAVAEMFTSN